MSGKAPPKGPRALLGTQLGSSSSPPTSSPPLGPSSHPHQHLLHNQLPPQRPSPSAPTLNINTRIGATPPTGPRSLQIGRPPASLKYSLTSHATPSSAPNGLGSHSLQSSRFPVSIKGKKRDIGTSSTSNNFWQSNHAQPNGCQDPIANGLPSSTTCRQPTPTLPLSPVAVTRPGELKHDRVAVTIAMQPRGLPRDRPTYLLDSPPPPPPPNDDPPPPPPPSQRPTTPPPPPPPSDLDIQPPPPPSSPSMEAQIQPPPPWSSPSTEVEIQPPPPRPLSLTLPTKSHLEPPPPAIEPSGSWSIPPPPTSPPPLLPLPLPPTSSPPPLPRLRCSSPPPEPSILPPPEPPLLPPISGHPSPLHLETSFLPSPSEPPSLPTTSEPLLLVQCSEAPSQLSSLLECCPQPPASSSRPPSPSPIIVPPESFSLSSLPPRPRSSPPPQSASWYNSNRRKESSARSRPPEPEPPKKIYSTPPLLSWPPPRSELPHHRPFKVLYDPAIDSPLTTPSSSSSLSHNPQSYPGYRPPSYYRSLIEHVRKHATSASIVQERIRGKGKGKEILYRCEGEVVGPAEPDNGMKEEEIIAKDPRKETGFKKPHPIRSLKTEFIEIPGYEYDENSTGPLPPLSVLIIGISPLTPTQNLRRNFQRHGNLISFEPQIDKENGSALGILFLKFCTHEEAKRCVEKENGRKGGLVPSGKPGDVEEWKAVLDGEGTKLKAVLKGLEDKKRREKEDKRREREWGLPFQPNGIVNAVASGSGSANGKSGQPDTPLSDKQSPAPRKGPNLPPHPRNSQQRPSDTNGWHSRPDPPKDGISSSSRPPTGDSTPPNNPDNPDIVDTKLSPVLDPTTAALRRARQGLNMMEPGLPSSSKSNSSTARGRNMQSKYEGYKVHTSRSPSPILDAPRPGTKSVADREKDHEEVVRELVENGHDHVMIPGGVQWMATVKDEDVTVFFDGFDLDKILRDHTAIYVTFAKPGVAQRAAMFLGSGQKQLGYQLVSVSAHKPPANLISTKKTHWEESEMIAEARNLIVEELRSMLEKDISEKLVGQELKKFIVEERSKATSALQREQKPLEKKGLKGLSFKKQVKEEVKVVEEEKEAEEEEEEEEEERPKKKRKTEKVKRPRKVVDADDLESEEEDEDDLIKLAALDLDGVRKRAISEEREEPVKKKQKIEVKGKKSISKVKQDELVLVDTELYKAPAVTRLYTSGFDSSLSPSRSPSPIAVPKRRKRPATPPSLPPPPEPIGLGLCDDDEDVYFAKLVLSNPMPIRENQQPSSSPPCSPDVPTFRKHTSGSARTEGYYKITHAEKVAYVVQYQARAANTAAAVPVDERLPQHVTSSRSNRANARRRAQGLEEINQVQRAVALSKGENAANELTFKFNQLQTRKKHLRFARSPIHDWGLYAMEKISRGEMVIEYVGEVIRAQVADKREKAYERQGIGSSYLFRIDEDLVVDATKKGNLGRLINHSCDPNCTAKIITISGEKKIVIYAKQEIELGDEITYDYHFPFEQDKIPCLCGSAKCRGFLN